MVGFGAGLWWPGPEKKRYGQTAPLGAAAVDEVEKLKQDAQTAI